MKHRTGEATELRRRDVRILCGDVTLEGELAIPASAGGVVLFAHGSGSSRHSPRNQFVAHVIRESGNGTLLFDLLTADEEIEDTVTARLRFDIPMLAQRLAAATRWLKAESEAADLSPGYFGSSTGGAAALIAAAQFGPGIGAVVSRGGRVDMASEALPGVVSPTLFVVGEFDDVVLQLNEAAFRMLTCEKELTIVPRATHLFEEPGALEAVAQIAADWFRKHLHRLPKARDPD